jgi:TRAP transporter TAXI family solute receptor
MTDTSDFGVTRRDFLRTTAAASGLVLGTSFGVGLPPLAAQAAAPLRWGSATPGASGYIIIEALASTVSKYSEAKGSAISTGGAAENMALLGTKEIDLGQTTSWAWTPAKNGDAPYNTVIEPVQLASYAIWSLHPMVLADSDIRTLDDLKGRRVSPGPQGGVTTYVWKVLFEKAGLYDQVEWSYGGWRESYDALKAGSIDCTGTVLVAGKPGGALAELSSTRKLRVLDVDPDLIKAVQESNPGAMTYTLTPENWDAVEKPVDVVTVAGILGAVPEISADTGYTIVKNIYDHAEEIQKISPVLRLIKLDFATQFLMPAFPVNAGAAKYYKEKGVWRDELKIAG